MKFISIGVLSVYLLIALNSCTPTESVVKETIKNAPSIYPAWYKNVEFTQDSLGYSGFATAVASDSAKAIERANQQAKIHLEKQIAQITEEIRLDLAKSGSTAANNSDFIILLRVAHSKVMNAKLSSAGIAREADGYFRGFSSVRITNTEVKTILETGFNGHPKYWGEFSSSEPFQSYF